MITLNETVFYKLGLSDRDIESFVLYLKRSSKVSSMDYLLQNKADARYKYNPRLYGFHMFDTWEEGEVLREAEKLFYPVLFVHTLHLHKSFIYRENNRLVAGELVRFSSLFDNITLVGENFVPICKLLNPVYVNEESILGNTSYKLLSQNNTSVNFDYWFRYMGKRNNNFEFKIYYGEL